MNEEKKYTLDEAAKYIGVTYLTLRNYVADSKIGHTKNAVGKVWFTKKNLDDFVNAEVVEGR